MVRIENNTPTDRSIQFPVKNNIRYFGLKVVALSGNIAAIKLENINLLLPYITPSQMAQWAGPWYHPPLALHIRDRADKFLQEKCNLTIVVPDFTKVKDDSSGNTRLYYDFRAWGNFLSTSLLLIHLPCKRLTCAGTIYCHENHFRQYK